MSDERLLMALREGDEAAFTALVEQHHGALVRLATVYVADRAMAEEVAQETWIAVLKGLNRFEGRSSLRNWIFAILVNRAKSRGRRERRIVPFSSLGGAEAESVEPAIDPDRFLDGEAAGGWASPPRSWKGVPEERLLSEETMRVLREAIAALPPQQGTVITLCDVDGWPSDEVAALLGISPGNQRVLLHRARAKVRGALERYLDQTQS